MAKLQRIFTPDENDSPFVVSLKKAVHASLATRYTDSQIRTFMLEAAALDPRMKLRGCITADIWDSVASKLTRHFESNEPQPLSVKVEPGTKAKPSDDSPPPAKKSLMEDVLDDEEDEVMFVSESKLTPQEMAASELAAYRKLPKLPSNANPLSFWREQSLNLPGLTELATKYMVVQATSVPAERVFSTAGDIVTAERACLDPEQVDALIFLKKNMESSSVNWNSQVH